MTRWPEPARFAAIAVPMRPSPMNPMSPCNRLPPADDDVLSKENAEFDPSSSMRHLLIDCAAARPVSSDHPIRPLVNLAIDGYGTCPSLLRLTRSCCEWAAAPLPWPADRRQAVNDRACAESQKEVHPHAGRITDTRWLHSG